MEAGKLSTCSLAKTPLAAHTAAAGTWSSPSQSDTTCFDVTNSREITTCTPVSKISAGVQHDAGLRRQSGTFAAGTAGPVFSMLGPGGSRTPASALTSRAGSALPATPIKARTTAPRTRHYRSSTGVLNLRNGEKRQLPTSGLAFGSSASVPTGRLHAVPAAAAGVPDVARVLRFDNDSECGTNSSGSVTSDVDCSAQPPISSATLESPPDAPGRRAGGQSDQDSVPKTSTAHHTDSTSLSERRDLLSKQLDQVKLDSCGTSTTSFVMASAEQGAAAGQKGHQSTAITGQEMLASTAERTAAAVGDFRPLMGGHAWHYYLLWFAALVVWSCGMLVTGFAVGVHAAAAVTHGTGACFVSAATAWWSA